MSSEGHALVLSWMVSSHISGLEEGMEGLRKMEMQMEKKRSEYVSDGRRARADSRFGLGLQV